MASPHTGGARGFSQPALERKLQNLTSTLQNIQALAQWAIHYRKHARTIISVWYKEMQKADTSHKLTLLYLANDIIQNSKKKGQEFRAEFTRVLPKAFHVASKVKDSSFHESVGHIIRVWEERNVFPQEAVTRFKTSFASSSLTSHRRTKSESDVKRNHSISRQHSTGSTSSPPQDDKPPNDRTPPEPDKLITSMVALEGEKGVCHESTVLQKIAAFPPEIQNQELLSKVKDKATADELGMKLAEAESVLLQYVKRLEEEEEQRRDLQELLEVFSWQQRQKLREAKKKLKHYQHKLDKVTGVREELTLKLARLPDLSKLPSTQGSLAPLPSVGDLFN